MIITFKNENVRLFPGYLATTRFTPPSMEIIPLLILWTTRLVLSLAAILLFVWLLLARPAFIAQKQPHNGTRQVDQTLLRRYVKALSVDYVPRDYTHPDQLDAAAGYIKTQFKKMGLNVEEQKFRVGGNEYQNLTVEFGPHSGTKIIVGAHYDAAGPYPGADDNASGVAALLELARLLRNQPLAKNITLVAYTLEELTPYGLDTMGSYRHAARERNNKSEIELMIALEMLGYYTDRPDSQSYPLKLLHLFYPQRGNFIAVVDQLFSAWGRKIKIAMSRTADIPVYSINAPRFIRGVDFSDHRNYWEQGYPAVMITDTAFYRNLTYHTQADTFDRLNYQKMAEVVYGLYAFLIESAGSKRE